MSKKFKVSGIPMFIIVDAETGNVITKDGRSAITEDPKGLNFPWRPPSLDELLSGKALKGSETVDLADEIKGKVVGFYFSAHWVRQRFRSFFI